MGEGEVSPEDIAADLGLDLNTIKEALTSKINPLDEIEDTQLADMSEVAKPKRGRPRVNEVRKPVTIYLRPEDAQQMKILAVERGGKIYELYDEGIALVLQKHGKR